VPPLRLGWVTSREVRDEWMETPAKTSGGASGGEEAAKLNNIPALDRRDPSDDPTETTLPGVASRGDAASNPNRGPGAGNPGGGPRALGEGAENVAAGSLRDVESPVERTSE
jgi:hypothetical protein